MSLAVTVQAAPLPEVAAVAPVPAPAADVAEIVPTAIAEACGRIAPLWPLRSFVAVNPFLGFAGQSFEATAARLQRIARIRMLMPRSFYRQAFEAGEFGHEDLAAALARTPRSLAGPATIQALKDALWAPPARGRKPRAVVATVAEVLDRLAAGDRHASRTAFMIDEISRWCAAYFDEGQAAWRLPGRDRTPYRAWRETMRHDRNAEAMGITGFRKAIAALPDDPEAAITEVVRDLGIPPRAVADYLTRAFLDIGGWAAYARHRAWTRNLRGEADTVMVDLLAIRLVWGYALFRERQDPEFRAAWMAAMAEAAALPGDEQLGDDPDLAVDLLLQAAYENSRQRNLVATLAAGAARPVVPAARKSVQAAFCIDVRSELYRRAIETVAPDLDTIGFAGFFGFPIEYVPIGQERGQAQCPVLLAPAFTVCEAVVDASPAEETAVLDLRRMRRQVGHAWKAFKASAVSCFAYVETAGLGFAAKLVGDGLGLTRPVPHPLHEGLDRSVLARLGPSLVPGQAGGRRTGFDADQRVAMAEAVLRAMSLTDGFARLVLLVGHGSTSVNNPHAAGLDCGACGGHTGEANARVAAGILNDPAVRAGLARRGIAVPADTWFVPALHDTTTDAVTLFDRQAVPASHGAELARLEGWLAEASALVRLERSGALGVGPDEADTALPARAMDWSQVRPEWGLAGNAAFVAAPRHRTAGLRLDGRAFLHSYDWRADTSGSVLELIMTAPMVVASWINLQYFGSTVNNRVFGSGNKVLHNVVGQLGVLEGNGGDLRVGLPWQSLHDGRKFVHEPVRLSVFVEAPEERIDAVLVKHAGVRELVENGWLTLFAIADDGGLLRRARRGGWTAEVRP
ncbi:YbcC family protein [Prosthecomicrobium sp. N25]|uniref:YbcC family protein n=1 Tax=Prosthecomicrobium sp. N25 TaxID=3129254 RepID=UPI0030773E0D